MESGAADRDETGMPTEATLVDLLEWRAESDPQGITYSFLDQFRGQEAGRELMLTHDQLRRRASAVAARIRCFSQTGDRVLVLNAPGLDYIVGLYACMMAGTVAVPVFPPENTRLMRGVDRVRAIAADVAPSCVLVDDDATGMDEYLPDAERVVTSEVPVALGETWRGESVSRERLAVLQYTSGSTGRPKGVMLSHGNLMANMRAGRDRYGLVDGMNGIFWIPPYHDMGLIGGIFTALFCGGRTRLFSPYSFMRDPLRWLYAVSAHKASVSAAPDFAYAMAARAAEAAPERIAEWDLSGWRVAISGAEQVRHSTIEAFSRAFAPVGFRKDAFHPSFGLAESTLLVTTEPAARTVAKLDARELEQQRVRDAAAGAMVRTLVGCGAGEQHVAVVDPVTRVRCAEDAVGEIWVRGDSVAQGYWGREQESEEVFRATLADTGEGPFLRTGDLGFLREGCLFVAGRAKDLVVVRGRNHHPQDLEQTCEEAHPQVRAGRCAAFSVDTGEDERLVVALEVRPSVPREVRQEIAGAICERVGELHDISVHEIGFVPPGGIPRTSSGKLQRSQVRAAYLAGEFEIAGRAEHRYVAPRDDVERAVADAWSRCLGVARVGVHDSFFALGGDSLKAAGLLGELASIAGHRLTMTDIATAHTLAELAEVLRCRTAHEQDGTAEIHVDLG